MALPVDTKSASNESPRIGLALGGGGARGLGHVAILEVLDDMGLKPAVMAGTSIGALLGAAYAAGWSGKEIRAHLLEALGDRFGLIRQLLGARSQPRQHILNVLPLRSALLDPKALLDLVLPSRLPEDTGDLAIPMAIVATDMLAREAVAFWHGDLKTQIAASIAIPVLFSPVTIDGRVHADGGLSNPLPLDVLDGRADILIGIDVSGGGDPQEMTAHPSVTTMLVHSVAVLQRTIIAERLQRARPDIYLDLDVGSFGALQFHKVREILAAADDAKPAFRRSLERILSATPA